MKLRGCLLTAALLPRCLLAGQAPKDAAAHDPATTFNVRSNLVLVRVVVRDRAGHADGHLQKEDFQVFDKGKPQSISQFSMEGTAGRQAEAARSPNVGENPPDPKSPPDHYVAYVFDDLHLSFGDLARAREAAERHMAESLRSTGRAAIFTSSGQIALDFTNDAAKLQEALRRLQPRALAAPSSTDCPNVTYYEADLIRNKNDAGGYVAVRPPAAGDGRHGAIDG
jgi:VWFA-related protein